MKTFKAHKTFNTQLNPIHVEGEIADQGSHPLHKLVISSPTYSCTHYFKTSPDCPEVGIWTVEVNTMSGMGFSRQVSPIQTMTKEDARKEWRRLINSGHYQVK